MRKASCNCGKCKKCRERESQARLRKLQKDDVTFHSFPWPEWTMYDVIRKYTLGEGYRGISRRSKACKFQMVQMSKGLL